MNSASFYIFCAHASDVIFNLIQLIVLISAAMSWFDINPYNPYVRFIRRITEPVYRPFRALLSRVTPAGIDLSPMIVILIVVTLQKIIPVYFMGLAFKANQ